jgi:hypothetical protein
MALKIGILTLPITENYGGILQAVALYRYLHSQGHDVTLIYKSYGSSNTKFWKEIVKNILLNIPFQDFKNLKVNKKAAQERDDRNILHKSFIEKEIFKISRNLYTKQDLEIFTKDERFDAVVVGSDQVWRKEYMGGVYYKNYFLDFVDVNTTKKIAFSASFGRDIWEGEDDSEEIAKCLSDFTAVSTRELSGVAVCKDSFGFNSAKHTLDPTFLIGKEFYLDMISKYDTSNVSKGGLLTYILDEADEKKEIIEYVQEELKLNNISHLKGFNHINTTYTVPQWVASFANADTVVTDSFHGMVFSIIFEKNFFLIGNYGRGIDRFVSLLGLLGLEERLVFDVKGLEGKELASVDYGRVNRILEENKKHSLEFLIGGLTYE